MVFRDKLTDWSNQVSSWVELFQVFVGTGLWQDGTDQQVFHCQFIPTFTRCLSILDGTDQQVIHCQFIPKSTRCLSILVVSPFLYKGFALSSPCRRRFRLVHASLEPGGSDSLRLNDSLCAVVWRWLDQRVSLRELALPSRGSTEWRKLCLDLSVFLAGSSSYREEAEGRFLVCVSQAGMRLPV